MASSVTASWYFEEDAYQQAFDEAEGRYSKMFKDPSVYRDEKKTSATRAAQIAAVSLIRLHGYVDAKVVRKRIKTNVLIVTGEELSKEEEEALRQERLLWAREALLYLLERSPDDPRVQAYHAEMQARAEDEDERAKALTTLTPRRTFPST